jgi:CDP-diacylglycerol--serine O-phosphatidyltransferase
VKKLIPSIFTIANLLCGFFAIVSQDIFIGSILILVALVLDVLDGALARMLDVASELGKQLDSFADLVSFGLAPAYLYTLISPMDGWVQYIPASAFVVGAAIRLARFNLLPPSKYFRGLPSPPSAFFLVGLFLGIHYQDGFILRCMSNNALYIAMPIMLGLLMNGKFSMFSLKSINSGFRRDKLFPLIVFLFFIAFLIFNFSLAIPLSIIFYLSMSWLYNIVARKSG